jgi:hypothetical protein
MWLQVNKRKRTDKLTFYGPCHITSAKEGLPPRILSMQACLQSKGGKPRWRGRHVDITWIKGQRAPKSPQNQVDTGNRPEDPQDSHHTKARAEVGPQGVGRPHRSAEPTLCRSSWPSTWCCLVGSGVHSWGVGGASTSCSRPINRREGTHILPNSLSKSSRTFGFQG